MRKIRFHTLDGIRGLAALLIVVRHAGYLFGVLFPESFLAVDVFFLLSGVVIGQSYEARLLAGMTAREFLWRRIVRIYPLYLLGSGLGVIAAIAGHRAGLWQSVVLIPAALLLLPNILIPPFALYPFNSPAWSLLFELLANIFYAVFLRFLDRRNTLILVAAAALPMVVLVVRTRHHSLNVGFNIGTLPGGAVRVGYSFFLGILLYRRQAGAGPARAGSLMPLFVLASVGALLMAAPAPALRPFYELGLVLLVFPLLVWLGLRFQPSGALARLFGFLGAVSYALYALHEPLWLLLEAGLKTIRLQPQDTAPWAGLVFLALLVLLGAWLGQAYDSPLRRALLRRGPAGRYAGRATIR